jgi:hypothetical protein
MTTRGYTILGWLVWRIASGFVKWKVSQNKAKLGAVGAIALVLVGGVLAAKSASGDDE